MACRLFGTKPSESMLHCCQLHHYDKCQWHFNQNTVTMQLHEKTVVAHAPHLQTLSQSVCTALTTGKCLPLGLCKRTVTGVWKRWEFPLVTWVHNTMGHRQAQSIFRPTNHKRVMSANYINPGYGLSLVDTLWNASSYRQPLEQEGNPMT